MFDIQVNRPKKKIELTFRMFKNKRNRSMIEMHDGKDRSTLLSFDAINTQVPSTLLSRWFNFWMGKELLVLAGKGSSVEYINWDKDVENTWKYREVVTIFGLHDVVDPKGKVRAVKIDDSIGMRNVVAILKLLGYDVITEFDTTKNRMVKIILEKEQ